MSEAQRTRQVVELAKDLLGERIVYEMNNGRVILHRYGRHDRDDIKTYDATEIVIQIHDSLCTECMEE